MRVNSANVQMEDLGSAFIDFDFLRLYHKSTSRRFDKCSQVFFLKILEKHLRLSAKSGGVDL